MKPCLWYVSELRARQLYCTWDGFTLQSILQHFWGTGVMLAECLRSNLTCQQAGFTVGVTRPHLQMIEHASNPPLSIQHCVHTRSCLAWLCQLGRHESFLDVDITVWGRKHCKVCLTLMMDGLLKTSQWPYFSCVLEASTFNHWQVSGFSEAWGAPTAWLILAGLSEPQLIVFSSFSWEDYSSGKWYQDDYSSVSG